MSNWRLLTWFTCSRDSGILEMLTWIVCMILCFFVTGFFCDLTEYQAAILHLKREHKEEIENLQVYLFDSTEPVVWDCYFVFSCAKVNIPLLLPYLLRQHLQLVALSRHCIYPGEGRLELHFPYNSIPIFKKCKCICLGKRYAWRKILVLFEKQEIR